MDAKQIERSSREMLFRSLHLGSFQPQGPAGRSISYLFYLLFFLLLHFNKQTLQELPESNGGREQVPQNILFFLKEKMKVAMVFNEP